MSSAVDLAVVYRIANAPVSLFPFPHLYVRDVFPADYYAALRAQLPAPGTMPTIEQSRGVRGYPDRFVLPLGGELPAGLTGPQREFWGQFARWILGGRLARAVLEKFEPYLEERLSQIPAFEIFDEAMLVHDRTNYALGPHTDSPAKVASLLIYVPRDPHFTCPGGPHHDFANFELMATMPFEPNSLFAFPKTSTCFHGVEPISEPGIGRDIVQYNLRLKILQGGQTSPGLQ